MPSCIRLEVRFPLDQRISCSDSCKKFTLSSPIARAYAREVGVGVKTPLELDILQNFITCAKEINCFRILFAC